MPSFAISCLTRAAVNVTTTIFPIAEKALIVEKMVWTCGMPVAFPSVSSKKTVPTSMPFFVNSRALGIIAA